MGALDGVSILLLEDEYMIAMDAQEILTELGARDVQVASTLDAARELARAERFDVAVLDLNVNGAMSYEVAEELRQRGVPIVIASGYEPREGGRHDPAGDAIRLTKPYSTERLREAVTAALAR